MLYHQLYHHKVVYVVLLVAFFQDRDKHINLWSQMSFARVGVYNVPEVMNYEKHSLIRQKEEKDYLDSFFKQEIGQEPLYSYSRSGDNPFQLMQLLHTLDEQRNTRISDSTLGNLTERMEDQSLVLYNNTSSEMNAAKKSSHILKDNVIPMKETRTTSGQIQPLKIPDAVVALAQAAAKANGETEKYLPGWPLFSPPKVQLQRCTKCSREFCSSINFRRHTRVHRRSLKIDKDFPKNRDYVGAFWDKLTVDQAKEILSLADVVIEGVNGSSIIRALSTWMCKPGFASLPLPYAKAGSVLLDMIQTKASRLPISSKELFNILDDASENTFLCTNTAACIQKFLFDGEAEKVALELKNVVACTSYMLEQKLVQSWYADKAAEALRCQKLLVEEEEAAQKRQAELMERKRMKKLRQKEQKLKDLMDEDLKVNIPEIVEDATVSPGIRSPKAISDSDMHAQEDLQYLTFPAEMASEVDYDLSMDLSVEDAGDNLSHEIRMGVDLRQPTISRRQHVGPTKHVRNGFVSGPTTASKHPALVRHAHYKVLNVSTGMNGQKTWTRKTQPEIEEKCSKDKLDIDNGHQSVLSENSEVLIGSISVAIEDSNEHLQDYRYSKDCHYQKKLHSPVSSLSVVNHSAVKLWRPVSCHENRHSITNISSNMQDKKYNISSSADNTIPIAENNPSSSDTDENRSERCSDSEVALRCADLQGPMFSSKEAAAFLSQRWKEAIAADHVKLVLHPETEASNCEGSCAAAPPHTSSDPLGRSILGNAENRMGGIDPAEVSACASKHKFKLKPENNCKLKYVPKQR